ISCLPLSLCVVCSPRPMACVESLKVSPSICLISVKYSRGLTRNRAPVGQFCSQLNARCFASGGLSGVLLHRLHLTATRSVVSSTGGGSGSGASLSRRCNLVGGFSSAFGRRGIIEIALYGHCVAQSPQPMQVFGLMSTWPAPKRPMAPVGQPVRHSGSWQCMQTDGERTDWKLDFGFGETGRVM